MLRRFYAQLPPFARPDHPIMRYLLLREGRRSARGSTVVRALGFALLIVLLPLGGWLIATRFGTQPIEIDNRFDAIYRTLYWSLIALQVLMRLTALSATVGVIAAEERQQTWDTLKITTEGALLTLKARWAATFYRLLPILVILSLARALFILIALYDLTTFQGKYIDILLGGTVPLGEPHLSKELAESVGVTSGVIIAALGMTGALVAPFTALAFDAALGLLIGTLARNRFTGILSQFGLILARLLITAWALWVGAAALGLNPLSQLNAALVGTMPSPVMGWLGAFFGVAEGDLGLTMLHFPYLQRMWADYDYGVFIGVAFLGYVLLQAALANVLVAVAARRAAQPDRF
ncbi:MAG: hypothetical protein CUN49_09895 [Candidatus Thermofonsia Clade 1 bacterium]|jgi:hypothetical protein|uniref:ABC transporter permease n=1 Tax=Candidatus Thermofonsia Clade 1 bacterium TaxID=2364210 RepID=A0A2M8PDE4_9CHLR|nr:MAG: hypothetical protein CUN49_09895 [Candidatus Thermofonsia Clade 1 bacterium]PJF42475.1 MAG: hypothetical protein CUN50_03935 [Candidatus Thermofonsia Clade 1 bacterium]